MDHLTLADISTGPDWILYAVAGVLAVISAILLLGKGSWLIAGYNTASKENKEKFDRKKLCRVVGGGLAVITAVILFMAVFEKVLPADFTGVFIIIVMLAIGIIEVLVHSVCKIETNEESEETV